MFTWGNFVKFLSSLIQKNELITFSSNFQQQKKKKKRQKKPQFGRKQDCKSSAL